MLGHLTWIRPGKVCVIVEAKLSYRSPHGRGGFEKVLCFLIVIRCLFWNVVRRVRSSFTYDF